MTDKLRPISHAPGKSYRQKQSELADMSTALLGDPEAVWGGRPEAWRPWVMPRTPSPLDEEIDLLRKSNRHPRLVEPEVLAIAGYDCPFFLARRFLLQGWMNGIEASDALERRRQEAEILTDARSSIDNLAKRIVTINKKYHRLLAHDGDRPAGTSSVLEELSEIYLRLVSMKRRISIRRAEGINNKASPTDLCVGLCMATAFGILTGRPATGDGIFAHFLWSALQSLPGSIQAANEEQTNAKSLARRSVKALAALRANRP